MVRPHLAGLRLWRKLVLELEPEYLGRDELLGVELPKEAAFVNKSCISDGEIGKSSWRLFERLDTPDLFGTRLRFNTSLRRTCDGLGERVSDSWTRWVSGVEVYIVDVKGVPRCELAAEPFAIWLELLEGWEVPGWDSFNVEKDVELQLDFGGLIPNGIYKKKKKTV